MKFMGSTLRPIGLEAGFAAVILSLLGTVVFGSVLLAAGQPGDYAQAAFPPLLAVGLAEAAGISRKDNSRALLLLAFLAFYLSQTAASLAAMG